MEYIVLKKKKINFSTAGLEAHGCALFAFLATDSLTSDDSPDHCTQN
jgi:hypothetical protein